jgi:hypothetical protein
MTFRIDANMNDRCTLIASSSGSKAKRKEKSPQLKKNKETMGLTGFEPVTSAV